MNTCLEMVMRVWVEKESACLEVGDYSEAPEADIVEIRTGPGEESKDWFGNVSIPLSLDQAEALSEALRIIVANKRSAGK